jgi:hypothetical protein
MELNRIGNRTTWNDASERLNDNFARIKTNIEALDSTIIKNKGYFITLEALRQALPSANIGDRAYVGASAPYTIYTWDSGAKAWVTDGTTGGDDDVNLGDYYTKEETQNLIDEYHEVMSQDEYDAILEKEDKFYFTYEEE